MKTIIDFLQQLAKNNDKRWFDAHKDEYLAAKRDLDAFAIEFMQGVELFDTRVHGLQLRDITYRIYRNLRFTNDKRPYKTWMGVYVCPKGKKSGMAGYYIHVEPATNTYLLAAGMYNPEKVVVKSIREEIMLEGEHFHETLEKCKDFTLPWDEALKKVPKGYDENDLHSDYYRLKTYTLFKPVTKRQITSKGFLKEALADLERCHDFNELLNRCYDYAYDENHD
ncbi:MAG: DUF2461 domain-containing protein [Prevotella sp.]|nr:DUF2461 domain-containing protein [Prevotella sp.]